MPASRASVSDSGSDTSRQSPTPVATTTDAHAPGLDRRGFLTLGATAAFAVSTASALTMSGCSAADRELIGTYQPLALTPKEFAVLTAFCARMVPAKAGTPTAAEAALARRIDKELTFHDNSTLKADVKAALFLIEHLTFTNGYFRRFSRLAPAAQDSYLATMARSDLSFQREPVNGLRFMALFFYYTDERTWKQIGYDGPMVPRKLPEADNTVGTA